MELIKTGLELQNILSKAAGNQSVGFVPTMGALHEGHLSLVKAAGVENEIVVVSIFVNPTQFNDPNDLMAYPRNLGKDLNMLQNTACNFVYAPAYEDVYPEPDNRKFDFGDLETVMEGKFRPGHFNGVAQVVSRLLGIVKPNKAYFGWKDFQQMAVIKALAKKLGIETEIIGCPIIREKNGLAMSSRNERLSAQERENAGVIYKTLGEARNIASGFSVKELKKWVTESINKTPGLNVEYFEIVDDTNLQPVKSWAENSVKVGCVAVFCGEVRLIDNIVFN